MVQKILVFDYDGTIVDSYRAYAGRFLTLLENYGLQGKVRDLKSLYASNFSTSLTEHGLTRKQILALIHDIREPFEGRPASIVPFPGMVKLLNVLTRRYCVYIVTSNLTSAIQESLEYWKIRGVKEIFGGDIELSKVKKLERIRKRYPRAEFFYIGDTAGDMHEAKEAGYVAVGVTWGYHTAKQLEAEHPDILLRKPAELGTLFA